MSRLTFAIGGLMLLAALTLAWRDRGKDRSWPAELKVARRPNPAKVEFPRLPTVRDQQQQPDSSAASSSRWRLRTSSDENNAGDGFVRLPPVEPHGEKTIIDIADEFPSLHPSRGAARTKIPRLPAVDPADQQQAKSASPPRPLALRRLPPVDQPTTPEHTPLAEDANLDFVPQAAAGDVILFAAGAVRLHPPNGWQIAEVPYGREVRLLLTPQESKDRRRMPRDGIWVTFHPSGLPRASDADDLERLLQARLELATGGSQVVGSETFRIGPWRAVRAEFTLETEPSVHPTGGKEESHADQLVNAPARRRGLHLLAETTWGVLELHAVSPFAAWPARRKSVEKLLTDLSLQAPREDQRQPVATVRDAAEIIGSWKAYHSRFRLFADGRLAIVLDRKTVRPLGAQSNEKKSTKRKHLLGRYEARGDLLIVRWDDGSKTNYRWRLREGELLLTDHEGQISQLRRYLH